MLKNIIFDIGDTVIDVSSWKNNLSDVLSNYFFKNYDINNKDFSLAFKSAMAEVNNEEKVNPHIDKINYVGHALAIKLGLNYKSEQDIKRFVKSFRNRNWRLFDNSEELLSKLSKKYNLYAVTNSRVETVNEIMDVFPIRKFFKSIIISEDSGMTKDDGGLFKFFLQSTGLAPEECIMVGNDLVRDGKAMQFGIPFCFVDRKNDFSEGGYTFKITDLNELCNILNLFENEHSGLPKHSKFYVKNGKHGLGCFASHFIRKNERIMLFKGPLITYAQTKTKEHREHYFQTGPESFQGKAPLRRRPVNHSCDPNAGIIGSETLIAIRNIKKGEEVTFDYSTTMYNDSATFRCSCGSRQCRHIIKEFRYLPEKTQQRYIEIGVVPKWLLKALAIK